MSLTGASISRISRELIDEDLVEERVRPRKKGVGRNPSELSINPFGGYIVAIAVNAARQVVSLTNLADQALGTVDLVIDHRDAPATVLGKATDAARSLLETNQIRHEQILGCSFAVAGSVDPARGVVRTSPMNGWENVEAGRYLMEALQLPIRVERIPNSMLLAESRFGIVKEFQNTLLINTSLSLGASLYLDHRLIRGPSYLAGFIGSLRMAYANSGAVQALEDEAGGWAVIRSLGFDARRETAAGHQSFHAKNLFSAITRAEQADDKATSAFAKAGAALGGFARMASDLLDLNAVIIAGPLAHVPAYFDAARESIYSEFDSVAQTQRRMPKVFASEITSEKAARALGVFEFLCQDVRSVPIDERLSAYN